jgi:hypothetical protein
MDVIYSNFTFAEGATQKDAGIFDSTFTCGQFKNQVQNALVTHFGSDGVSRGDKAIGVHKNTYRIDADVVACFEHRRYVKNGEENLTYLSGTEFCPDGGGRIINWPHQHYENGVAKNDATGMRFKAVARILKRLRNKMAEDNVPEADPIASYLLECLAWNTPNEGFGHDEYALDVRYVLAHTFHETELDEKCKEWAEVNELKYLFRSSQPWKREQARAFARAAWNYVGFQG